MSSFLGEMGGLVAIALFLTLLIKFLTDAGFLAPDFARGFFAPAALAALAGVFVLFLGGIITQFFVDSSVSLWSVGDVWGVSRLEFYIAFFVSCAGFTALALSIEGGLMALLIPFAFLSFTRVPIALAVLISGVLSLVFFRGKIKLSLPAWASGGLAALDAFLLIWVIIK